MNPNPCEHEWETRWASMKTLEDLMVVISNTNIKIGSFEDDMIPIQKLAEAIYSWFKEQGYSKAEDFEVCNYNSDDFIICEGGNKVTRRNISSLEEVERVSKWICPSCHGMGIVRKESKL